jgi:peptidoglycan/LPS O-acetylase OafA/YrhL
LVKGQRKLYANFGALFDKVKNGLQTYNCLQKQNTNKYKNKYNMSLRKFRPDIEGLRAIAVLLVVIAHANLGLKSGFIGVDIFFVISGFLITSHLFNEAIKHGTISLSQFYSRRILRIFPASMFVLVATLLASFIWLSPLQLLSYAYDALFAALSGLNYRLAITGTDYFNVVTVPSPFQHFWSLCLEEQFYFIWPLVMLILAKLFSKKSYFGHIVSGFLVAVIMASLYASYTVTQVSSTWAYFGLNTRAWQLAIGALLAINIKQFANLNSKLASFLSWVGFGGLVTGLALITEQTPYPGLWALLPTLATALVIASGVNKNAFSFESFFGHKVFQYIGKISYSWYLIHWPVFVIYLLAGKRNNLVDQLGIMAITFILSVISYYIIENPIRYNAYFKGSLKRGYALGFSLVLIAVSISGGVILLKNSSTNDKIAKASEFSPHASSTLELAKKIEEATFTKEIPTNLAVPLETASIDKPKTGCIADKAELIPVLSNSKCIFGDIRSSKTIVLIGDSHAYQWGSPISEVAKNNGYKVIEYTKSGCPMQNITHEDQFLKRDYTECYSWREEAFKQIETINPDIIITTGIVYYKSNELAFDEYIKKLKGITNRVVSIVDTPRPADDVLIPECLAKNTNDIQKCSLKLPEAMRASKKVEAQIKVAKDNNIDVVETKDMFCFKDVCPAVINDIVVYHDNSHISNTYAKYLTTLLEEKIFPKAK